MAEMEFVRWLITAVGGLAVWFMKNTLTNTQEELRQLQNGLNDIKRDYLHKDDFKEFKTELRGMFDEIKTDIRELKHQKNGPQ